MIKHKSDSKREDRGDIGKEGKKGRVFGHRGCEFLKEGREVGSRETSALGPIRRSTLTRMALTKGGLVNSCSPGVLSATRHLPKKGPAH